MYDRALALDPHKIDALNGLGTMYEARAQCVWSKADSADQEAHAQHRELLAMA